MKKTYRAVLRALAAALLAGSMILAAAPAPAADPLDRPPDKVAKDLIGAFGKSGDLEDAKVRALLRELKRKDAALGGLWEEILVYWDDLNRNLTVNQDRLPDGLPEDGSLCIAVLGYALAPDGSPQKELIARLRTALACAEQYPRARVLCTGGGTASENRDATEADRMGAWLIGNGLDPARLIIENRSGSTAENALFSAEILRAEHPEVESVALVSSGYHIAWGQLLFEAVFMKNAALYGAPRLRVVSNAACMFENARFADATRYMISGLRLLVD